MKDAAIVLFLNSIDEQVYVIVQKLRPVWVDELEADIIEYSLSHWHQDISDICEVMDDPDDPNCVNNLERGGQQADVSQILCDDTEMNDMMMEKLKNRVDLIRESLLATDQIVRSNEIDISETQRLYENKINQLIQHYEDEKKKIKGCHERMISELIKACNADVEQAAKDLPITTVEVDKNQSKIYDYFLSTD